MYYESVLGNMGMDLAYSDTAFYGDNNIITRLLYDGSTNSFACLSAIKWRHLVNNKTVSFVGVYVYFRPFNSNLVTNARSRSL